ncbi:hypothetical protein FN846DRAFT_894386 [Sphaerosporella brunnea]|uniref:Uncharacterized protein n=1 Tax=Sphaerosporella brunnea TaxID=1250544 RepID=A0A5J5EKH6_9PEZI|nr:hypothetical protein FN846DRAFT_894386 [Sphaerosporella brunnea]
MSEYHGHSNQSLNPACVCPDATPTLDIFSIELRQFSQRLVRCCLRVGQVSASLFWPQDLLDDAAAAPDGKVPCWPVLEWFQLHTNVDNAQGEWVFTGEDPTASNPPDSDEESEQPENKSNRFRDTPCVEYFNTFHYSVALAATKQMPRLRWLKIRFQNPCSRDPYRGYIFTYTDGLATRAGAEAWTDTGNPRIEWAGDILYDPEDRVKQLWRDKAGSRLEVDVVEYRDLQPGWRRRRRLGIPEEGPLGWLRFRNGVMIEWDDGGRMIWGDCA